MIPDSDHVRETAKAFGLDRPGRHALWEQRLGVVEPLIKDLRAYNAAEPGSVVDDGMPAPEGFPRTGSGSAGVLAGKSPFHQRPGSCETRIRDALATAERHADKNALTAVFAEQALHHARRLDKSVSAGEPVGLLAGKAIVVKDFLNVRGYRVTAGTRAFQGQAVSADAPAVRHLRDADGVILGMANLHALAYGALGTSSDFGATTNPLVEGAISGGSSSGSAVAVALGIADIAVGTDTGGSIRAPAAACGVVGFKPTYDRISREGVVPLAPDLDHVGAVARTVDDCALAFQVMAQSVAPAHDSQRADLSDVVVGVPATYFGEYSSDVVKAALEHAMAAIARLGARLVQVDIPSIAWAPAAQRCILAAEAFHTHLELLRERGSELVEDVRLRLELGMFYSAADLVKAHQIRTRLQAEIRMAMCEARLLLTPTLPVPVPQRGRSVVHINGTDVSTQLAMTMFSLPFNLTGQPALSLPWLPDGQGGMIAMQLVGRPLGDHFLLGAARVIERAHGDARKT